MILRAICIGEIHTYIKPLTKNGEMLQLIGTEIKSYRIISISGQTVQSGNAENSIQIKNLASGLYILKLSTDKGEISKKLVIKN